jgi:hypothetical protein
MEEIKMDVEEYCRVKKLKFKHFVIDTFIVDANTPNEVRQILVAINQIVDVLIDISEQGNRNTRTLVQIQEMLNKESL